MNIGDKVVYKPAFWRGPPAERRRLVFKVVATELCEAKTDTIRVSVMAGSGQLVQDIEADRFEIVEPAHPPPPARP